LFGHSVRSELLVLYLVETLVCFVTIYALLTFGLAKALPIDRTAALLCSALLASLLGPRLQRQRAYQPVIWRRLGRFLLGSAVAALLLLLLASLALAVVAPEQSAAAHWRTLAEVLTGLLAATMVTWPLPPPCAAG
jgi:hypothetical protein